MSSTEQFLKARNFLLQHRDDYDKAYRDFRWPELTHFNWAFDWFDFFAKTHPQQDALWLIKADETEQKVTFGQLSENSNRVASYLKKIGISRGDRILYMLPNVLPLWEIMLGAMKLGAIVVPTSVLATPPELSDRMRRASVNLVITDLAGTEKMKEILGDYKKVVVGISLKEQRPKDWLPYEDAYSETPLFIPEGKTNATDPLLFYFTSGTTAQAKMVTHTHQSYPVGHLSTMYWIGIQEGDIHQNISSPGWAKHAWSSFFAPWNAGATIFVHDYARFNSAQTIRLLHEKGVHTLCAPPTVWRLMLLDSLGSKPQALRELASAGEPLNPEVISQVQKEWNLTIRDGYGQTETTAQIGNSPGQKLKLGSMGRPLPGYSISLLDKNGSESSDGEVAIRLDSKPHGLMAGYQDDLKKTVEAFSNGFYKTGDEAKLDEEGYFWFIGRGDDVFKSSDYRISPFELESVLLEHEWVAEAAVIPSPDRIRLCVPKAVVTLKPGITGDARTAIDIFNFANARMAAFKRIRRIEFSELPKTISGKIRRTQLRREEQDRRNQDLRSKNEFWLEDLPSPS